MGSRSGFVRSGGSAKTCVLSNTAGRFRLEDTLAKIEVARRLAESAGSRLVLILMPFKEQVYIPLLVAQGRLPPDMYHPSYDLLYDTLLTRADRIGVAALDLRAALRSEAQANVKLYFTVDGHLTPAGHQAVARAIARGLVGLRGPVAVPSPAGRGAPRPVLRGLACFDA